MEPTTPTTTTTTASSSDDVDAEAITFLSNDKFLEMLKGRANAGLITCNGRPHLGGLRPSFELRTLPNPNGGVELRVTSHQDFRFSLLDFEKCVGGCLDMVRPEGADNKGAVFVATPYQQEIVEVDREESTCNLMTLCQIRNAEVLCVARFEFDFEENALCIGLNAMPNVDNYVDDNLAEFWLNIYL